MHILYRPFIIEIHIWAIGTIHPWLPLEGFQTHGHMPKGWIEMSKSRTSLDQFCGMGVFYGIICIFKTGNI